MKLLWPAAILLTLVGCAKQKVISLTDYDSSLAPCEIPVPDGWKISTPREAKAESPTVVHGNGTLELSPAILKEDTQLGEILLPAPGEDPPETMNIAGYEVTLLDFGGRDSAPAIAYFNFGKYYGAFLAKGDGTAKEKLVSFLEDTLPKIKCD